MISMFPRFRLVSRSLERAIVHQIVENANISFVPYGILKQSIHTSTLDQKKRLSQEERVTESVTGRQVIRYSPKNTKVVEIWRNMSVRELAQVLGKSTDHVLEALQFSLNAALAAERFHEDSLIYNDRVIRDVVRISGFKCKFATRPTQKEENKDAVPAPPAPAKNLKPRPPVVTVMGHVDHGKTTLLDSLRNTSVVEQEFGGITQHIGAFEVELGNGEVVTFLDTPGHAAFTAMRARGANVTDIVVLVVAADDGVMEQTIESIKMANAANVPIIVAVNKIDKPTADIDRTHRLLAQQGIVVEQMGGEVQSVPVSALKKQNLDLLVETISLQAQLKQLKADPTGLVEGVIIESQTDIRKGKMATMIVQRGTLKNRCILVAGESWAKVRLLMSHDGSILNEAPPSTPVQVVGWKELPNAGDMVLEVESEKHAGEVMKWRHSKKMEEKQMSDYEVIALKEAEKRAIYREQLEKKRLLGRFRLRPEGPRQKLYVKSNDPTLSIVVKGDVDGSVEAILHVIDTYDDHSSCKFDLLHFGVGQVSENDLEMAEAFKGIVYAFNVECPKNVEELAMQMGVTIKHFNVIYKMIDDIKEELNLRILSTETEELLGEANVLQPFTINERRKKVSVAGCRCLKGVLKKSALCKIVRGENEVIYKGNIFAIKHFKNDVDTVKKDMECGLRFADNDVDLRPGDHVICYHMIDVKNVTKWDPGF